jgi:hypothetical protein
MFWGVKIANPSSGPKIWPALTTINSVFIYHTKSTDDGRLLLLPQAVGAY